jgi:hypothetical protein
VSNHAVAALFDTVRTAEPLRGALPPFTPLGSEVAVDED